MTQNILSPSQQSVSREKLTALQHDCSVCQIHSPKEEMIQQWLRLFPRLMCRKNAQWQLLWIEITEWASHQGEQIYSKSIATSLSGIKIEIFLGGYFINIIRKQSMKAIKVQDLLLRFWVDIHTDAMKPEKPRKKLYCYFWATVPVTPWCLHQREGAYLLTSV